MLRFMAGCLNTLTTFDVGVVSLPRTKMLFLPNRFFFTFKTELSVFQFIASILFFLFNNKNK